LFKVFVARDSRYNIKRGPHLLASGVCGLSWVFLGCGTAWGFCDLQGWGALGQSFAGWVAGCWVCGRSVAVSGEAFCSKCFWQGITSSRSRPESLSHFLGNGSQCSWWRGRRFLRQFFFVSISTSLFGRSRLVSFASSFPLFSRLVIFGRHHGASILQYSSCCFATLHHLQFCLTSLTFLALFGSSLATSYAKRSFATVHPIAELLCQMKSPQFPPHFATGFTERCNSGDSEDMA
jgi:hypothetical protein